jgi:hypothetical protein
MPDNGRIGRKDDHLMADITQEIEDTVNQELVPKYENPNRDRARGDFDRSRKHTNNPGEVGP